MIEMKIVIRESEGTMIEEKRGWMGRNTFWSHDMAWTRLMGISDSKTQIIDTHSSELLK
jgi:hypothetical protein